MLGLRFKAEPLRKVPEEDLLEQLDKVLDGAERKFSKAVLRAMRDAASGTDIRNFDFFLAAGDVARALEAVPWRQFEDALLKIVGPEGPLLPALKKAHGLGLQMLPPLPPAGGPPLPPTDFERLAGKAVDYLERHGADLVSGLSGETRRGMRLLLQESFTAPRNRLSLAREVREVLQVRQANGLIGVTEIQAGALQRRINAWTADPDLSPARIQQLIDREHRRMVRERAERIAQTETSAAGNEGLLQIWGERAVDGAPVQVNGAFESGVRRPPLHPKCFCQLRLRRVKLEDGSYVFRPEWVTRVVKVCPKCRALDEALAA